MSPGPFIRSGGLSLLVVSFLKVKTLSHFIKCLFPTSVDGYVLFCLCMKNIFSQRETDFLVLEESQLIRDMVCFRFVTDLIC